jgi:hypothetical protein
MQQGISITRYIYRKCIHRTVEMIKILLLTSVFDVYKMSVFADIGIVVEF